MSALLMAHDLREMERRCTSHGRRVLEAAATFYIGKFDSGSPDLCLSTTRLARMVLGLPQKWCIEVTHGLWSRSSCGGHQPFKMHSTSAHLWWSVVWIHMKILNHVSALGALHLIKNPVSVW